jgi:hypothetical protein
MNEIWLAPHSLIIKSSFILSLVVMLLIDRFGHKQSTSNGPKKKRKIHYR